MPSPLTSKEVKAAKARVTQRLAERRELRKCLPEILADVAALVGKEAATQTTLEASSVPGLVRALAAQLEGADGTESKYRVDVLGTLSDLALMQHKSQPKSTLSALPLDTPADIVRWFASYLEVTLEKRDLLLVDGAP
jgi:hypothetical protein